MARAKLSAVETGARRKAKKKKKNKNKARISRRKKHRRDKQRKSEKEKGMARARISSLSWRFPWIPYVAKGKISVAMEISLKS